MASHFGPTGPVAAVYAWLESVKAGDFASAWARMDDNLRLCRAQAWLWNNRTFPDIAAVNLDKEAQRITASPSTSAFWEHFARTELHRLEESWEGYFAAYEAGTLGAASASRVIGPDLEVVVLHDTGSQKAVIFDGPTLLTDTLPFTVRLMSDGWKVAAYGDFLPTPGWPPQLERPMDE